MERQGGFLDLESHKLLYILNTTHSPLPPPVLESCEALGMINFFSLTPKMLISDLCCHCNLDLSMISYFLIHSHSRNEFSSSQMTISSRTSVAHPSGEHGLIHQQCNTSEVCHQGWLTGHKTGYDS